MGSNTEIAPELLALLRCPATMQPLRLAPPEVLAQLRRAPAPEPFEAALLREDGTVAYPVLNGIPVLLPEAGLATTQS